MIISSSGARRVPAIKIVSSPPIPIVDSLPVPAKMAVSRTGEIAIGQRLRDWKTLAGFGIGAAIAIFFALTAHLDLAAIWANIRAADVRYLVLALVVYFGAFLFRGLRWRLLLLRAGFSPEVRLPSLWGIVEMIYLSWFVNCLLPAKLGDGYRAYLMSKRTGANTERTLGTVVGERMADVLALAALLSASGLLIIGYLAGGGANLRIILVIGLVLVGAIVGAMVAVRLASEPLLRRLPARWRELGGRFLEGMLLTFRRDIQFPLYGLTCLTWGCEVLRIWLVLQSFHIGGISLGVVMFTALAGSLLSTIPFTPAGLGAVEGASLAILAAFGVSAGLAGAVAVVDRLINYWSNIPVGALLFIASRRK